MKNLAISGFGRIGRSTLRAALTNGLFVPTAIVDVQDPQALAQLFKADSNYGLWPENVQFKDGNFIIGDRIIPYFNTKETGFEWEKLGVDVVVECTGLSTKREWSEKHLAAGAKHVLVSAPCKTKEDCDITVVKGLNLQAFNSDKHQIVSMASCTTNGLAPLVAVLDAYFEIEFGLFSTIHAYTNSQSLVDQPKKDRRDSWAACENIIPSSSGAAKALGLIIPRIDGKITGKAYRVPNRTGSIVELTAVLSTKSVTVEDINDLFREVASGNALRLPSQLTEVMGVLEEEWASSRILGAPESCLVDLPLTQVNGPLVSVAGWYDNEMGYSNRLAEVAAYIASK